MYCDMIIEKAVTCININMVTLRIKINQMRRKTTEHYFWHHVCHNPEIINRTIGK